MPNGSYRQARKGNPATIVRVLTIFPSARSTPLREVWKELVVQGIGNNLLVPLTGGTLGAVAGALLIAMEVALIRRSPQAASLANAAAISTLAVALRWIAQALRVGTVAWPMTLAGLTWPLVLMLPRPPWTHARPVRSMRVVPALLFEQPGDRDAVRALNEAAFGGRDEADIVAGLDLGRARSSSRRSRRLTQ